MSPLYFDLGSYPSARCDSPGFSNKNHSWVVPSGILALVGFVPLEMDPSRKASDMLALVKFVALSHE